MNTDMELNLTTMITKSIPTVTHAYSTGYMAGILRVPIKKCPFNRKTIAHKNWLRGHERGSEVVQMHIKGLRPKPQFERESQSHKME